MLPQKQSFYSIFDLFDEIFRNPFFDHIPNEVPYPTFPPCDVELDEKSKDLTFKFALAGYPKENIHISFEDDMMLLNVDKVEVEEDENSTTLRNAIKKSGFSAKYAIPQSRYDIGEAKADYVDGILEVKIPARESVKPLSLPIN